MRVVAHISFLEQYTLVVQSYPVVKKSLDKQLEKAGASPHSSGELMHSVAHPSLRGKLYKVWVHGPGLPKHKGHRLLYLLYKRDQGDDGSVLPFFISPRPRTTFNYDQFPWQQYAEEIYQALIEGRQEEFVIFEPWKEA
ncbi:MAG: hypothetical protein HYY09_08455 [Firmicutes bacterium]|nr:hypothetical protein [Bacillota bacterium]